MALATCLWSSAGAGMLLDPTLQEVVMWSERQLTLPWTLAGLWCPVILPEGRLLLLYGPSGDFTWFTFTMPWLSDQP